MDPWSWYRHATLKNTPKNNSPNTKQFDAMNKALDDTFNGKGISCIDRKPDLQTVFQGKDNTAQARCGGIKTGIYLAITI